MGIVLVVGKGKKKKKNGNGFCLVSEKVREKRKENPMASW